MSTDLQCYGLDSDELISLLDPVDGAAIVLVGSIYEGFAHKRSDIDLLVVVPDEFTVLGWKDGQTAPRAVAKVFDPSRSGTRAGFPTRECLIVNTRCASGAKVQYTITSCATFSELQQRVLIQRADCDERRMGTPTSKLRRGQFLQPPEQKLLHRLYNGLPLIQFQLIDALRRQMSLTNLSDHLADFFASASHGLISDIFGTLDIQGECWDEAAAGFLRQRLVIGVLSAYLASVGETNLSEKFVIPMLKRHRNSPEWGTVSRGAQYLQCPEKLLSSSTDCLAWALDVLDIAGERCPFAATDTLKWRRLFEG